MKRQLIEDFLNLPGITGVALIDGQTRAYVHGLPADTVAAQQQLTEGIQQILETTPDTLEAFTFYFQQRLVFLHKVEGGMALLVVATPDIAEAYSKLIAQLTRFMRTDFEAVVNALITVAQPVWVLEAGAAVTPAALPIVDLATSHGNGRSFTSAVPTSGSATVPANGPVTMPANGPVTMPANVSANAIARSDEAYLEGDTRENGNITAPTLAEVEMALNQLSRFTTQYLGKFIVANHWRSYRPNDRWVSQFQITTTGTITVKTDGAQTLCLTPSQLALVQTWVADFSQRCAKIIRDYPKLVRSQALDARQWQLLFGSDTV